MNIFETIDLSTFESKDSLNPAIFDSENDKMKIDVRQSLLDIANDFFEDLGLKIEYEDILLVGSNANYNWSEYSDVDVHISLDFSKISDDLEFVKSFLDDKKNLWNLNHNVKIDIYKVEMYVQDSGGEDVNSGGIYSILTDTWIRHPENIEVNLDINAVQQNVNTFMEKFKKTFKKASNPEEFKNALDELSDYLHDQRKKGLELDGEFSPENIAYKYLRRKGVHDKIRKLKYQAYDISKSVGHGTTIGSYLGDKKQRQLSGNKNYVDKMDKLTDYNDKKGKKKDLHYSDGIFYSIHGVLYSSLRTASAKTGEKKSTIQYRVHSKNPKYSDYKVMYKK